jgi:hypothetical protein
MPQFRKKPVVIEAVQLNWANWPEVCDILGPALSPENPAWNIPPGEESDSCGEKGDGPGFIALNVTTTHGETAIVRHGDWIIPDSKPGTFYPCKPDVFEKTYEAI